MVEDAIKKKKKKFSQRGIWYKENIMGPKIDPCGTPQRRETDADSQESKLTEKHLIDRYDLKHCKAVPLIPIQCSK